jgi:tetratricopeptide (TPR) repeat protein
MKLTLTRTIWAILLLPFILILLTVFADSNNLANGIVTAKYFWFYAGMGIMIPFILFMKPVRRFCKADLFIILFVVSIILTALLSGAPILKTKFVLLLLLLVLYIQLRKIFSNYKSAGQLLSFIIICTGLLECIIGLKQLYGFERSNHALFKLTGTFFNPGPYSGYLSIIFPLALHYSIVFYKNEMRIRKIILKYIANKPFYHVIYKPNLPGSYLYGVTSLITVFLTIIIIPAGMSRASWLAIILGSLFVIFNHFSLDKFLKKISSSKRKRNISIIFTLISIPCFLVALYSFKKESADGRILIWKHSFETIKEKPFGSGLGYFGGVVGKAQYNYYKDNQPSQAEINVAGVPEYAFNEYLQICVESGLHTVIIFLTMIILTLINARKKCKIPESGSLITLLVFAFFSYPFSLLPFLIIFTFLLALCNSEFINNLSLESQTSHKVFYISEKVASVLIISICLINRYPTYKAYEKWNECKTYINAGLYKDTWPELKKIYPLLDDKVEFLFDYAYSLSKSNLYLKSNHILTKAMQLSSDPMLYNIYGKNCQALKQYSLAESYYLKAYYLVPNRIYPLYLLTKLYYEQGLTVKASQTAHKVLDMNIKVSSNAVEEIKDSLKYLLKI